MAKIYNHKSKALTICLLLSSAVAMATNTALTTGAWEKPSNWSSNSVPTAADVVNIPAGITITIKVAGDVCASLNIAATGDLIINSNESLSIGGSLTNAGTMLVASGSTLTFNGAANSIISGGGTYTISGTVAMNMGAPATFLDVQDTKFIAGINSGGKYYLTFTQGTWRMDNTGTLNDAYNSGSNSALTIPYGVIIESDAGVMNLGRKASTGSMILSGELFVNGGSVYVQTGQAFNAGQDFQYYVNGGTPQLYIASGTLDIGAGFNALTTSDYIDFNMSGGTIILAYSGYSNSITFQLADVVGGKTVMTAGLIILQDACNANIEDLDMGGANVKATLYSVTGGTIQLGYVNTQASSSYFGIDAQPTTNYPNFTFQSGTAKNASAFHGGTINLLSLYVNSNMTFDATGFPTVNIMSSNGTFAFDEEGGFVQANNTVEFSGSVPQLINSYTQASETFYNLQISNTSGNVILGVPTNISNQLTFTSGLLDATNYVLKINSGASATGTSASSYVIVGNGVTTHGYLNIQNLGQNTNTLFPIGTSTYYLPAYINPGSNAGTAYSAYVFVGATTNATYGATPLSAGILATMVNAIWNISQTTGSNSAAITLNWASSGTALEGSTFQLYGSDIGIQQYVGGYLPATGSGTVASATATSSFGTFTQFAVAGNFHTLALVLSDFNASLENNKTVLLTWSASGEAAISDFEVIKSTDGINWNTLGTVQASDNTATTNNYSLIDPNPATGTNYYRIITRNASGSVSYSDIKTISLSATGSAGGISVFPVPASSVINISLGNANPGITVRLVSAAGQILQSSLPGNTINSIITMNVSSYAAGVYFVQVISGTQVLQTNTVLIAR